MQRRLLLSTLLFGACTTIPPEDTGLAPAATGVVGGEVVVSWPLAEAHPVVLFLSQVDLTTGATTTVNVTVIAEEGLDEGDGTGTTPAPGDPLLIRTATYTFPRVKEGAYVITGLVDVDENFNLLVSGMNAPTCADLLGAHVDLATGAPRVFEVKPNQVLSEISVIFGTPPSTSGACAPPTTPTPSPTATPNP